MAKYFAGGHLRFVNGEWRDDNGNAIEISRVRHGRWEYVIEIVPGVSAGQCSECGRCDFVKNYCPNCGCKMSKEE